MTNEISDTEYEVMVAIWRGYPATAKEIIERLNEIKTFHPKTAYTLINRLVKKEALSFEKEGRSYKYYPLIDKEDYVKRKSEHFLQKLFNGKISPLVANFVADDSINKQDIEDLKKLIQEWEDKND